MQSLANYWRVQSIPSSYGSYITESADERFDKLWDRAKSQYRIVGERSSSYLNWRYTSFKTRHYSYYCLTEKPEAELVGYIVFSVEAKNISIADLFVADPDGKAWEHLLVGFAAQMRKEGAQSLVISYFGTAAFEQRLQRLGFFRRTRLCTLLVYSDPDLPKEFTQTVYDRENWFLLDGEMDI